MLKQRFDLLVFRTFLIHWAVVAALLLGLFAGLDVLGHGDEIGESNRLYGGIFSELVTYFLLNLPFQLVQFAPYITLLAGMAAVMGFSRTRQWTPVLTAGRSAARALLPMFVGALLIGVSLVAVREVLLPQIAGQREALMRKVFNQREWEMSGLAIRTSDDSRLQAGLFIPEQGIIRGFELYSRSFSDGIDPFPSDRLLLADVARWDGERWLLENGRLIDSDNNRQQVWDFKHQELTPTDLVVAYFSLVAPLDLSAAQLSDVLARDPGHRQAATLLWSLRAAPLVHLILLLLGIPFVFRFDRRSAIDGFAWGLLLSMLYFVAEIVFLDMGARGAISPFLGGTASSFIFLSVALMRLARQPGLIAGNQPGMIGKSPALSE